MIDYLLKFPSVETAVQFGLDSGFVEIANGEPHTTLATHTYAVNIIGEHITSTGTPENPVPPTSDGNWWILFRDRVGIEKPPGTEQYIVWDSASGLPRPQDAPNHQWL